MQVIAVCDVERESDRCNKGIIKKAGTLGREALHERCRQDRRRRLADQQRSSVRLYEEQEPLPQLHDAFQDGLAPAAPVETAHRSITIAHLANIGLQLGSKTLRWDPAAERVLSNDEAEAMRSRPMRSPWRLA